MKWTRRKAIIGACALPAAAGAYWSRFHRSAAESSQIAIEIADGRRLVHANALPNHAAGDFPNPHDPIPIRPQTLSLQMPLSPTIANQPTPLRMWLFGVAVNGVPFDPSGPFWNADGASGWQFEVLHPSNAVALGIDVHHAHTQGRGMYHYHGLPTGLLWSLKLATPGCPTFLLGYAADGFPIYGPDCPGDPADLQSKARRLRSSYRLRTGKRKSGPAGRYSGAFVEDFEYVPGHGDLDECNGRIGPTTEYPNGTYYYVLTDEFPFVPRLYRGAPDHSFRHGPPPGVSPPLPPELRNFSAQEPTSSA